MFIYSFTFDLLFPLISSCAPWKQRTCLFYSSLPVVLRRVPSTEKAFRECLLNECMINSSRKTPTLSACYLPGTGLSLYIHSLTHQLNSSTSSRNADYPLFTDDTVEAWNGQPHKGTAAQVICYSHPNPSDLKLLFARYGGSGRLNCTFITLKDKENVLTKGPRARSRKETEVFQPRFLRTPTQR